MSRNKDSTGPDRTSATLEKIEQAILRVGAIRQQYINQCQNGGISPRLRKEFHSAVINYFIELRPFRDHQSVKDDWEHAEILTGDDGDSVEGFENLLLWVNKTRPSQSNAPGRGQSTRGSREPETLPPQQLLRISMKLDDIAHELGFAPEGETPVADPTEAVV